MSDFNELKQILDDQATRGIKEYGEVVYREDKTTLTNRIVMELPRQSLLFIFSLDGRFLEKIATDNNDKLAYSFVIVPSRDYKNFFLRCAFIVREDADDHEILTGTGAKLEDALQAAQDGWKECLKSFGYKVE